MPAHVRLFPSAPGDGAERRNSTPLRHRCSRAAHPALCESRLPGAIGLVKFVLRSEEVSPCISSALWRNGLCVRPRLFVSDAWGIF